MMNKDLRWKTKCISETLGYWFTLLSKRGQILSMFILVNPRYALSKVTLMQTYYDYFDFTAYKGKGYHSIPAPLNKLPVLVRGGSIIPRKDRLRGSSDRMSRDPYTLLITLSDEVLLTSEMNTR
jgi:hypothetical protein